MVSERLPGFQIDIHRLRQHFENEVLPRYTPVEASQFFGGWSVLSHNGSYREGWAGGGAAHKKVDGNWLIDREFLRKVGYVQDGVQMQPTEICFGYLQEVMDQLKGLQLCPRRVRIAYLKPGGSLTWHLDETPDRYAVRLHIPIITNADCEFATKDEGSVHMPADGGAYLVKVNRIHSAFNRGTTLRHHLIMQVWDTRHLSQHHRFAESFLNKYFCE